MAGIEGPFLEAGWSDSESGIADPSNHFSAVAWLGAAFYRETPRFGIDVVVISLKADPATTKVGCKRV